jgi:hypothetical protein
LDRRDILPDHSTETGAGSDGGAELANTIIARVSQPSRGRARGPRPSGKPEDDGENVADEESDAVEEVGRPDLDGGGTAIDDEAEEGLDGLVRFAALLKCT